MLIKPKLDELQAQPLMMQTNFSTHVVTNQAPPLANYNLYSRDIALQEAVAREGAAWANASLLALGAKLGEPEVMALGFAANRNPPVLHTHDRYGNRRDEVEFHPAWHELMSLGVREGLHTAPWSGSHSAEHVARAAAYLLYGQIENGTQCPMTMTYASVPVLQKHVAALPVLKNVWLPRLLSRDYDARFLPIEQKRGALIGMGMTEKQGGSDVRTNTTRAVAVNSEGTGKEYRLTGHKWFMSVPMSDAFLVLAKTDAGVGCFFVPRFLPDGTLNALRFQRLKDKLGNKSNASSEVEFEGATGWLLGDEGRGVSTIVEMATYTRLDCAVGTASMMRQALTQAIHHTQHRTAFGKRLALQPLMQNVLADLAIESEAATVLALRLARAFDNQADESEAELRRLITPAAKYWICKRGPMFAAEAMEVLGGNGYVEESVMPRLYREMPVNSIWEGSGNVMCLDVLRAASRGPKVFEAYFAEVEKAKGGDARLDAYVASLKQTVMQPNLDECQARRITESLALALQASLLVQYAPHTISDAFCATRIARDAGGASGGAMGTLPSQVKMSEIIERAWVS
jgi:putative acyl-CoA dehydrogenase